MSANVANSIYDRYATGSRVQVTYVKSRPEWFYVPGGEPTQSDAAIFDEVLYYGAVAAFYARSACLLSYPGVSATAHQTTSLQYRGNFLAPAAARASRALS